MEPEVITLRDVLLALLASLPAVIALVGVLLASGRTRRAMLDAEDVRAANALAAEDRRAHAAIEAEDRRHAHSVALTRMTRASEARHDLYVQVEAARREIASATYAMEEIHLMEPLHPTGVAVRVHRERFSEARRALADLLDEVALYASPVVYDDVFHLFVVAMEVEAALVTMEKRPERTPSGPLKERRGRLLDRSRELLAAMRKELGADD